MLDEWKGPLFLPVRTWGQEKWLAQLFQSSVPEEPEYLTSLPTSLLPAQSDQIRSVAQSCPTLCDPMNRSTPGLPVCHQLPEFTQTHVHRVSDAIQQSHPLLSPSPPTLNISQHQGLFQWVSSWHQVPKGLELQLQHHANFEESLCRKRVCREAPLLKPLK